MYSDDLRKKLLVKALRKSGWAVVHNGEKDLLRRDKYFVRLDEDSFTLHVSLSDQLVVVKKFSYGRRQAQLLGRAITKHRKESMQCGKHTSSSKGDQ